MKTPHKTKSRTFRRIKVTTPGGNHVIHHKRRKPSKAHCHCGALLPAVPHEIPRKMQNTMKSKKRPERPFGGVLCSACMRKKIVDSVRKPATTLSGDQ